MRWLKYSTRPDYTQRRKTRFLFFPKCLPKYYTTTLGIAQIGESQWRWLEQATWVDEWISDPDPPTPWFGKGWWAGRCWESE